MIRRVDATVFIECLRGLSFPARRLVVALGLVLAQLVGALAQENEALPADLTKLSQQLEDDRFAVRQSAQRRLTAIGLQQVAQAFAEIEPPPSGPLGTDRSEYFEALTADAQRHLQQHFFARLPESREVEGLLRLERIRRDLTAEIDERVTRIRAKYPEKLPDDQARLVEGITGGFRDQERWFDASYHNRSSFAITATRVQLRVELQGKKIEKEILLGGSSKPIPAGSSGTWSAEVEPLREGTYDIFWRTVAVYGYPVKKQELP